MPIDITAAEQFVHTNSRLLERHRLAVAVHGGPVEPVLDALRAYRNPDGGFGHALEPDVRGPGSQPAAALSALEVLVEIGTTTDPMVSGVADWTATIAADDGRVPQVLPSADGYPRAPWMDPAGDVDFLTYVIAAKLWQAGCEHEWLRRATDWCWSTLEDGDEPVGGYTVKFALDFLDAVPEPQRAVDAVERLRPAVGADGCIPIGGGIEDEKLRPLDLSPQPGVPSRALFTDEQIAADLDRLEQRQLDDGGWDFEFLHWSDGQAVEWRGIVTLGALATLAANGRLDLASMGT